MIIALDNYLDLMNKLESDLSRFAGEESVFHLMDCLLTLNAIPEWIANDDSAPTALRATAETKLIVMKGHSPGFVFDEIRLATDIDQQLRFIRLISNHSKHKKDTSSLPSIWQGEAVFSMTFPVRFGFFIRVSEKSSIDAKRILQCVSTFWKDEIASAHP